MDSLTINLQDSVLNQTKDILNKTDILLNKTEILLETSNVSLLNSNNVIDRIDSTIHILSLQSNISQNLLNNSDSILHFTRNILENENLQNKILGIPENLAQILIPTLITLFVFISGEIIVSYRNKLSNLNKLINYRDVIYNWIDLIKGPIEKQINSCRDLSTRIGASQEIQPERFEYREILANKLNTISLDSFISIFVLNSFKKGNNDTTNEIQTFNLVSQINFLESIEKSTMVTYENYQKQIIDLLEEWNKHFMELDSIQSNWGRIIAPTRGSHPYFNFYNEVVRISLEWQASAQGEPSTIVNTMNNLITPLTTWVTSEINANPGNEFAYQLALSLQQLRIIHLRWNTNIQGSSQLFNDIADRLQSSYDALVKAKKYFVEETEMNSIFKIR